MSEILVAGAGMVGVSTALALQAQGHHVTLLDSTLQCRETSYGNAGIIQAEAAEPYALPRDLPTLCKYALGLSNDVLWHPQALLQMAPALWRYFRASSTVRHRDTSSLYSQLTGRATQDHTPLITAANAEALISKSGLSILYRDAQPFDQATQQVERMYSSYGVTSQVLDGAAYRAQEPALKITPAGVIHWNQSWSCSNPGALTDAYSQLFIQRGGCRQQGDANSLSQTATGWRISSQDGSIEASQVVIALGPWSPTLLARFGYRIPMIYKRGYHAHFNAPIVPKRPFLDAANGVVVAAMQQGLRVTSGAALVKLQSPAAAVQLKRGVQALGDLIELGQPLQEPQWFGTRPCMPDMLPLVGAAPRHKGLWFNFGHGHQGFTLGPTTAALLADAISGQTSDLIHRLAPARRL
ncbi:NAD(P)/FAD-dependent oxidoreductase [Nitrincola sp.]|uniref:NAD(P)/FAD-dependent oxidoreductase n=1 Tax=Nitrincola sp. TaxID=1926584 RepID=UPI003A93B72A